MSRRACRRRRAVLSGVGARALSTRGRRSRAWCAGTGRDDDVRGVRALRPGRPGRRTSNLRGDRRGAWLLTATTVPIISPRCGASSGGSFSSACAISPRPTRNSRPRRNGCLGAAMTSVDRRRHARAPARRGGVARLGERYEITGVWAAAAWAWSTPPRTARSIARWRSKCSIAPAHDAARACRRKRRSSPGSNIQGSCRFTTPGTLADGRVFYVMKLVRGARLDEALDGEPTTVERLDVFTTHREAVSFAHAQGIVHRDSEARQRDGRAVRRGARHGLGRGAQPGARRRPRRVSSARRGSWRRSRPRIVGDRATSRADVFALGAILRSDAAVAAAGSPGGDRRQVRAPRTSRDAIHGRIALAGILRFRHGEPVEAYRETLLERGGRVYRRYRSADSARSWRI